VFTRLAMPPLGPLYIAAAVREREGWEVEVIDENNWTGRGDHRALQERRPADVVGFYGGLTSTVPRLYQVAQQYRDMGVFTIAGGGHVDSLPDEALASGVDLVVHGEGEESILEILSAWERGQSFGGIEGVSFAGAGGELITTPRRAPILDFSGIARPDFEMIIERRRPFRELPVAHLRGCPYQCEFCSVNHLLGPTHGHSIEQTVEYLDGLVSRGYREFFFVDDNFVTERTQTIELCRRIAEVASSKCAKLKIYVQLRTEVARDEEVMAAMREAGVMLVALGLESPLAEDLKSMRKGQTVEQMIRDLAAFRRWGFYIHGMFIFAYPARPGMPSPQIPLWMQARVFLDFIRKTGIDTVQVLKAVPVPGTKLFERLRAQDRILPLEDVGWEHYDGNFLTYMPDDDQFSQVHEGAVWIMKKFYGGANLLRLGLLVVFAPVIMGANSVRDWYRLMRERGAHLKRERKRRALTFAEWWQLAQESLREGYAGFARSFRNTSLRSAGYFIVRRWLAQTRRGRFMEVLRKLRGPRERSRAH